MITRIAPDATPPPARREPAWRKRLRQAGAERKRAERKRKRQAGFVLRQVWVHPDDWPRVRRFIEQIRERHLP